VETKVEGFTLSFINWTAIAQLLWIVGFKYYETGRLVLTGYE
jgi:hypothetical protein